jgi:hypothetical protein
MRQPLSPLHIAFNSIVKCEDVTPLADANYVIRMISGVGGGLSDGAPYPDRISFHGRCCHLPPLRQKRIEADGLFLLLL